MMSGSYLLSRCCPSKSSPLDGSTIHIADRHNPTCSVAHRMMWVSSVEVTFDGNNQASLAGRVAACSCWNCMPWASHCIVIEYLRLPCLRWPLTDQSPAAASMQLANRV